MKSMWMVRAGRKGRFIDEFREKAIVAVGWIDLSSLKPFDTKERMVKAVKETWPDWNAVKVGNNAGQLLRFGHEVSVGDDVITYDPQTRAYLVGTIKSEYEYLPGSVNDWGHIRQVNWNTEVDRDKLSTATRNSLGSLSTLFKIPDSAAEEIRAVAAGQTPASEVDQEEVVDDSNLLEDIEDRAIEFIKDRISSLSWDDMEELVAGILRAMGYKTEVSPHGPDRGKDIIASPDGFGFESPRIIVEVKHRKGAMGSQAIRSFLGGRHKDDKGLYVSTGGFSKDAYYEAERANIPITLLTLDGLVEKLLEHYGQLDQETQQLIPLKMVYWPI